MANKHNITVLADRAEIAEHMTETLRSKLLIFFVFSAHKNESPGKRGVLFGVKIAGDDGQLD